MSVAVCCGECACFAMDLRSLIDNSSDHESLHTIGLMVRDMAAQVRISDCTRHGDSPPHAQLPESDLAELRLAYERRASELKAAALVRIEPASLHHSV